MVKNVHETCLQTHVALSRNIDDDCIDYCRLMVTIVPTWPAVAVRHGRRLCVCCLAALRSGLQAHADFHLQPDGTSNAELFDPA